MKIIARYITKEILLAFLVITLVLLLIVLSNRFAMYLAKAATGELPLKLVFNIVSLYIPELMSYLLPLGFFMALLFAFGRLYADSEMTVLLACGIGWKYIIKLTLCIALIFTMLTFFLTLWLVPTVTRLKEEALSEGEAAGIMQSLLPGRFQTFADGQLVFYLEDIASKKEALKGIFIAERPNNDNKKDQGWALITAKKAYLQRDKKKENFYLILQDGHRYQGKPGEHNYTVISFKEYGRSIPKRQESAANDTLRLKNTLELFKSHQKEDAAELQWRFSLPLSVMILALIALPLARVEPRHGRYAKFIPAMVIYILYYNAFTICRRWVENGVLPSYLGAWWVHAVFLIVAIILLAYSSGWVRRIKYENTR